MEVEYFGKSLDITLDNIASPDEIITSLVIDLRGAMHILINELGEVFKPEKGIYTEGSVDPLPKIPPNLRIKVKKHTWLNDCLAYTAAAIISNELRDLYFVLPKSDVLDSRRFLNTNTNINTATLKLSRYIQSLDKVLGKYEDNVIGFEYKNSCLIVNIGHDWRVAAFLMNVVNDIIKHDSDLEMGLLNTN